MQMSCNLSMLIQEEGRLKKQGIHLSNLTS